MAGVIDERKPNIGPSAAVGKIATAGTLGTLSTWLTATFGRQFFGSNIDDPLYFSLISSGVLAVMLNVKLYGFAFLKWAADTYLPAGLLDRLKQAKSANRSDGPPNTP